MVLLGLTWWKATGKETLELASIVEDFTWAMGEALPFAVPLARKIAAAIEARQKSDRVPKKSARAKGE